MIIGYKISRVTLHIIFLQKIEKKLDDKEKALDQALEESTSAGEAWSGVGLAFADTMFNVVAPTMATAGAGALMASTMTNAESIVAGTMFGGKLLMDNVAKPFMESRKQEATSITAQQPAPNNHPILSILGKPKAELQKLLDLYEDDGAKIDWLKVEKEEIVSKGKVVLKVQKKNLEQTKLKEQKGLKKNINSIFKEIEGHYKDIEKVSSTIFWLQLCLIQLFFSNLKKGLKLWMICMKQQLS